MKTLALWTDGGARGNPGPAGIGVAIYDDAGEVVDEIAQYLGETTNNQAEYQAMLAGLKRALELEAQVIVLHSDSELMVKQLNGIYKVKNPGIKPLHAEAKTLLAQFDQYTVKHVRRELNKHADRLANEAMDAQG